MAVASRLPVRVKALAVAVRAKTVPGLDCVPVHIAVGRVAVGTESGIVVEPGLVNLDETQRRPQRPSDLTGPDGINGNTVAVSGRGTGDQEMPSPRLALS